MTPHQNPVVMFVGGGTLGPVLPLLAVLDALREKSPLPLRVTWVATPDGPEHLILAAEKDIEVVSLGSAKLRRYWAWQNLLAPFVFLASIVRAWTIVRRIRPTIVVSAGGFTAVPVHIVAWLHRIPSHVHQQDVIVGLTNKIVAPMASSLTCAFAASKAQLPSYAAVIGNPVRSDVTQGSRARARKEWGIADDRPVVLVLGGGLGAQALNDAMRDGLSTLTQHAHVLHVTGRGKMNTTHAHEHYTQLEFLGRAHMADAYAVADLVIARAGMGTVSELALLRKAAILVPIPGSHQEANAHEVFRSRAARIATTDTVVHTACDLLADESVLAHMREAWPGVLRTDAGMRIALMVLHIISSRGRRADAPTHTS